MRRVNCRELWGFCRWGLCSGGVGVRWAGCKGSGGCRRAGTGSSCAAHEGLGDSSASGAPGQCGEHPRPGVWGCSGQGPACPRVPRGCGCARPCHCGVRDEPKIPAARKGCPEEGLLPGSSAASRARARGAPPARCLCRQCQHSPGWNCRDGQSCLLARGSRAGVGYKKSTHSHAAFLFPEQLILCSDLEYPVAGGEVLFLFPWCFSPSRRPGQSSSVTTKNPRGFCL